MQSAIIPTTKRAYSTDELAAALKVRPNTPRSGLCRDGHYMGMRQTKLPNGRLLWDAAAVDAILTGEGA